MLSLTPAKKRAIVAEASPPARTRRDSHSESARGLLCGKVFRLRRARGGAPTSSGVYSRIRAALWRLSGPLRPRQWPVTVHEMSARLVILALLVGIALPGCRGGDRYTLQGQIVAVDPARQEITIKHGDIAGFMPGMTMAFKVQGRVDDAGEGCRRPGGCHAGHRRLGGISLLDCRHRPRAIDRAPARTVEHGSAGDRRRGPGCRDGRPGWSRQASVRLARQGDGRDLHLHALPDA